MTKSNADQPRKRKTKRIGGVTQVGARRPRGADVAQLAGVSQSAVSRALRPGGSASSSVRERVESAAATLGYRPNMLARAMITRKTSVIAVVIAGSTTTYYPEVLRELCISIARRGCRAMVFMVDGASDEAAAVDSMLSYRIDAAIALVSLSDHHLDLLQRHDIALLFYNREGPGPGRSAVSCDHILAGTLAVRHLVELGHRRFAYIDGPQGSPVASQRLEGVIAALSQAGISPSTLLVVVGDYSYGSGRSAMAQLKAQRSAFSAIIACNDAMAAAAVDVIRYEWSCYVPKDVSVVGFDGTEFGSWEAYGLTTLVQPVRYLCDAAVDIITDHTNIDGGERRLFNAILRPGQTSGPVGRAFQVTSARQ